MRRVQVRYRASADAAQADKRVANAQEQAGHQPAEEAREYPAVAISDVTSSLTMERDKGQGVKRACTKRPCHPERSEGSLDGQKSLPLAPPLTSILPNPNAYDPVVILHCVQDDKGWWVSYAPDSHATVV